MYCSGCLYMHLMWKRLGREPLINAEVYSFCDPYPLKEFPEVYLVRMAPRFKKWNWFPRTTSLYSLRSSMFITSEESFNVGGISRTPRESSEGTLLFMIHRDGLSLSFLVWAFMPFGPRPRIESTPHTIIIIIF